MCGFDGGGGGGDGFTVVEVAMFSNALIYLYLCFSISLQKGFFLSGWVKQIAQFKSLTWVKNGVNILNDMSSFWPLIILDEILSVNWSLSISKGNGEDPDPFFSYDSNAKSYFDLIKKKKKKLLTSKWFAKFPASSLIKFIYLCRSNFLFSKKM